ncbi:E3 ubiquitin-protein ligase RNF125 isoform X1 [Lissotriton helveticus]
MGSMIGSVARGKEEAEPPVLSYPPLGDSGEPEPSAFYCSVCLEVLCRPVRTRCGHVFCRSCLAASVQSNSYACPYCRAHLSAEGAPAADIIKKMKTVFQNCEECKQKVCLSDMRDHLNMCEDYLKKYGPLQELGNCLASECFYACPYCQPVVELDEDGLVQHCLSNHGTERRLVVCPICQLIPGGDPSYMSTLAKHLHDRHSLYYEDYIDISIVEEALIERVLDLSVLQYARHTNRPYAGQTE